MATLKNFSVFGSHNFEYDVLRYDVFDIYPAFCSQILRSIVFCLSIILENYYVSLLPAGVCLFVILVQVGCPVTAALRWAQ